MNSNESRTIRANGNLPASQTLILIGLAGLATLLLATIPLFEPINFSFRLLITMVHELSHGLAALLTGGRFIRFVVFPDGSGLAYTAGGWRLLVIPAGYIGVALFGAGLIMLGRSSHWSRIAMGAMGIAMIIFALLHGTPSIFTVDIIGGILTTISGVFFGSLFLIIALRASTRWIIFLLHLIAIQAGFTAFADIINLIGLSIPTLAPSANDARSMAELTFIPAIIWAILWAIIAVAAIGGAIWITWLKPIATKSAVNKLPTRLHL